MLKIDDARVAAGKLRTTLGRAERAISGLHWLLEHSDGANMVVNCHDASACHGHREAMQYLNAQLDLPSLIAKAKEHAHADMARALGASV